jgi:predicted DNA-binding protein (MmcQ/YjbR family)
MDRVGELRQRLCDTACRLPGSHVDFPWGERVVKVGKKVFLFLGTDDPAAPWPPGMGVKLVASHEEAMATPGARPSGYGLGRAGWVSIPFDDATPPVDVLERWVVESYRTVAPKRLVAELDAQSDG